MVSAALTILLSVAIGAYVHYQFRAPAGLVARHAASLDFRRATVARPPGAGPGQYRYFFATNRNNRNISDTGVDRFGRGRMAGLSYGSFDVSLAHTRGLGLLVDPTRWLLTEEIRLDAVDLTTRRAFTDALRAQVDASPDRSLLVIVLGADETLPFALRKTAFLGHILDLDTPILVFDWPGDHGRTFSGYRRARSVAEASGAELAEVMRLAIEGVDPRRLWLLASGLGARVATDAFSRLMAVEAFADSEAEFDHVVFAAPDAGVADVDGPFREEISALARRLTVYVSSDDRAPLLARVVADAGRAVTESSLAAGPLEEARRLSGLVEPGSDAIALVDVTPVVRTGSLRALRLETPEFFDDLYLRLTNEETPRSRLIYPVRASGGEVYWVLNRSR